MLPFLSFVWGLPCTEHYCGCCPINWSLVSNDFTSQSHINICKAAAFLIVCWNAAIYWHSIACLWQVLLQHLFFIILPTNYSGGNEGLSSTAFGLNSFPRSCLGYCLLNILFTESNRSFFPKLYPLLINQDMADNILQERIRHEIIIAFLLCLEFTILVHYIWTWNAETSQYLSVTRMFVICMWAQVQKYCHYGTAHSQWKLSFFG